MRPKGLGEATRPVLRLTTENNADPVKINMLKSNCMAGERTLGLEVRRLSMLSAFLLCAVVICTGLWLIFFVRLEGLVRATEQQASAHTAAARIVRSDLQKLQQQVRTVDATVYDLRISVERLARRSVPGEHPAPLDRDRILPSSRDVPQRPAAAGGMGVPAAD